MKDLHYGRHFDDGAEERFWAKVDRQGPDDCWVWLGARSSAGYGYFCIYYKGWRTVRAHKLAYVRHHGKEVGKGLYVCHNCQNKLCVNPRHLREDTNQGNQLENVALGRHRNGAEARRRLTVEEVARIRTARERGEKPYAIGRGLGLQYGSVKQILNRTTYKEFP
jgi:hypothetical protein